MKEEDIVATIKAQYNRELRKQIVKSIINNEKDSTQDGLESTYKIINQIFSYVISQIEWNISDDSTKWDDTPLKIMCEVFPKIEITKWYKEQILHAKNSIRLENKI